MTATTRKNSGIFITGSDTGVGKTWFACLLAAELHRRGCRVSPRKPAESGCTPQHGELVPADALALQQASGTGESLETICPWRFEAPVSPASAAAEAGIDLTTAQLVRACVSGSEDRFLLVEGAGGFYSPLARDGLNADLATALQLPVILVVGDRLGCLNHALLSLEAIARRGLDTAAVILNRIDPEAPADNLASLRQLTDIPVYPLVREQEHLAPELLESLPIPTP